jgi:hypothetical protein
VLADPKHPIEYEGTWAPGVILFGPHDGRIYRVADTGGTTTALDIFEGNTDPKNFVSARFLPDGRHLIVSVVGTPAVYVSTVDASETRDVLCM